ncbi:hypothetical protein ABK040_015466 [Willaertia magna]
MSNSTAKCLPPWERLRLLRVYEHESTVSSISILTIFRAVTYGVMLFFLILFLLFHKSKFLSNNRSGIIAIFILFAFLVNSFLLIDLIPTNVYTFTNFVTNSTTLSTVTNYLVDYVAKPQRELYARIYEHVAYPIALNGGYDSKIGLIRSDGLTAAAANPIINQTGLAPNQIFNDAITFIHISFTSLLHFFLITTFIYYYLHYIILSYIERKKLRLVKQLEKSLPMIDNLQILSSNENSTLKKNLRDSNLSYFEDESNQQNDTTSIQSSSDSRPSFLFGNNDSYTSTSSFSLQNSSSQNGNSLPVSSFGTSFMVGESVSPLGILNNNQYHNGHGQSQRIPTPHSRHGNQRHATQSSSNKYGEGFTSTSTAPPPQHLSKRKRNNNIVEMNDNLSQISGNSSNTGTFINNNQRRMNNNNTNTMTTSSTGTNSGNVTNDKGLTKNITVESKTDNIWINSQRILYGALMTITCITLIILLFIDLFGNERYSFLKNKKSAKTEEEQPKFNLLYFLWYHDVLFYRRESLFITLFLIVNIIGMLITDLVVTFQKGINGVVKIYVYKIVFTILFEFLLLFIFPGMMLFFTIYRNYKISKLQKEFIESNNSLQRNTNQQITLQNYFPTEFLLRKILKDKYLNKIFQEFLQREFTISGLLLYKGIKEYFHLKELEQFAKQKLKLLHIYNHFLLENSILRIKELNINLLDIPNIDNTIEMEKYLENVKEEVLFYLLDAYTRFYLNCKEFRTYVAMHPNL